MRKLRFGVIVFPGSNGDQDCLYLLNEVLGVPTDAVWHEETRLAGYDALILPGGFSYGDYLRAGAIARFSPVVAPLRAFAADGGPVLGICNGFQILTEAGLLPGALLRNERLSFVCRTVHVRVEPGARATPFTDGVPSGTVWRLPIAHGEGRYFANPETLDALTTGKQIVLRYCDAAGRVGGDANPNGSSADIAGICNAAGNVLGLMPHPERAGEDLVGGSDGLALFRALVESCTRAGADLRPVAAGR